MHRMGIGWSLLLIIHAQVEIVLGEEIVFRQADIVEFRKIVVGRFRSYCCPWLIQIERKIVIEGKVVGVIFRFFCGKRGRSGCMIGLRSLFHGSLRCDA